MKRFEARKLAIRNLIFSGIKLGVTVLNLWRIAFFYKDTVADQ